MQDHDGQSPTADRSQRTPDPRAWPCAVRWFFVASLLTAAAPAIAQPAAATTARLAAQAARDATTGTPRAAPVSPWDDAVNAFKYQDFDHAIPRLRKLIYPTTRLERAREWLAREYLAAALWWSGKKQPALDEFTALLVRNPVARLDPAYYPPQMIKDFAQLRANLIRLGVIKKGQKPVAPKSKVRRQPPELALMFFPFGVGQFANDQALKGSLFLGSEVALAGTSIGLYLFNRDLGVNGKRNDTTRGWQVATGAVFWGVMVWGVVDAVVRRGVIADELARAVRRLAR